MILRGPYRRDHVGGRLTFLVGLFFAGMLLGMAIGCASPQHPREHVLESHEAKLARSIADRLGVEWSATTIHGLTVYASADEASDVCLRAHEQEHNRQEAEMGTYRYIEMYLGEMAACLGQRPSEFQERFGACYLGVSLEVAARRVQTRCLEGR